MVFRQVKSGRVIMNSAEEFSMAANKFVLSIVTLLQKDKICSASHMTSTGQPLFQQPYKYINLFGQLQLRVV